MNKKTTGLVAGAAGAALLMGGATFALWSDSADVEGGTITAGNLDVGTVTQVWEDVSDGVERGTIDDLAEYRIVPGDTIRGTITVPASLEGDHMYADLAVPDLERLTSGHLYAGLELEGLDVSVDGEPIAGPNHQVRFASADNVDKKGLPEIGKDSTITVVVEATFDHDTSGQFLTEAVAELEDFAVTLTQVRG